MAIGDFFPGVSGAADSVEVRKALSGLVVRDTSGAPRAGVFPRHSNALVTSTATMNVNVAAFEGLTVRAGGVLFAQNDGTVAVTLATAPVSNSRIDVIYFKQNEVSVPVPVDGTNTPVIDKVTGTAAASPVKPALPTGATELATVLVPAGATATNAGGVTITQTYQYTAASGGVVWVRNATELAAWVAADGGLAYRIDTGGMHQRASGSWDALVPAHNQQLDTTNSLIAARFQSGMGKIQGNNTSQITEVVTFPVAFSSMPVVTPVYIGFRDPVGAFNPVGLSAAGAQPIAAMSISSTGFTVTMSLPTGTWANTRDWYYQWIAIGAA